MTVHIESTQEARAVALDAANHCRLSCERMGHEWHGCQCGLCSAVRALDKAADELYRFSSGR